MERFGKKETLKTKKPKSKVLIVEKKNNKKKQKKILLPLQKNQVRHKTYPNMLKRTPAFITKNYHERLTKKGDNNG